MSDLISRADAIEAVLGLAQLNGRVPTDSVIFQIKALPSAETVSREEYEETDGVVTIEKQRANEVGKVKHIVVHSPNYTRYFYNESMPISNELPNTTDCTNFLLWLLDEIMDEDNWELNAVADGEIIARKLKKLGLLEVKDGYYHDISRATEESLRNAFYDGFNTATEALPSADAVEVDRTSEWVAVRREEYEELIADADPTETSTLGEKHQLSHGRLIDADELKTHLDGAWEELNDDGMRKGVRLARWFLISAPTIDSTIQVVRCKDCRYRKKVGTSYYCDLDEFNVKDADFCSWGERREP